jgi:diguanylate cyclase (GGDEF)-like protein
VSLNYLKILLIEDNLTDADLIEELLSEVGDIDFNLTIFQRLQGALQSLKRDCFDVILLDLSLPDSQGLQTLAQVKNEACEIPILVLTALNDQKIAIEAAKQGAQDYLIKGKFEGELLVRAIRYAIERHSTAQALKQQNIRTRLMGKMIEHIRRSLDLNTILQTTVSEVHQFLKTDHVLIYRCKSLEQNNPGAIVAESISSSCTFSFYPETCFRILPRSLCDDQDLDLDALQAVDEQQIKSLLTVPIWHPGNSEINAEQQLWGMLVAHHYDDCREWQKWEIDFLKQLADQVAIAIQQSELYRKLQIANQKLERLANLDGLTEVANRRQFDQVLSQEWSRLAREKKPLSLILCDIDFFKAYNDKYGHPAGDTCLKKVARILQESIKRAADLVARYGGEEFAIILPDTNKNGAFIVAQEICHRLEELKLLHQDSLVNQYLTLSLGICCQIPSQSSSYEALVARADQALYQAKSEGRNRIVIG